ncbi:MAG: sulfurtransferase-like selenium metabolism protein YedF [Firmicutes bacterium]|nr:sulfurtransferase-like selenium metabolism protein YedF [Bacillota bacterium]
MAHQTVDCRGLACPQPVINTKKALEEEGVTSVTAIVDNDVARQNVALFAVNMGYEVAEETKDGLFYLRINQPGEVLPPKEAAFEKPSAAPPAGLAPVYLITTNSLGQGSPDLGQVLIKSLFTALAETDPPPVSLLFLNTGVFLTCAGSEVTDQLKRLSDAGAVILSCGACLNYYNLTEKLQLGSISNMFEINNRLTGPQKVITIA